MTPRDLEPRVGTLEEQVAQLTRTTAQLKRDQSATRRLVRELGKTVKTLADRVDSILPGVDEKLAHQTGQINSHVDDQLAEQQKFVLEALVRAAGQWPAPALVAVTFVLTLAAGVLANWILAAEHLPHIH